MNIIVTDIKMRTAKMRTYSGTEKNEKWDDPDTAGYWSYRYLWLYPTKSEALKHIKADLKRRGYL